MTFFQKKNDEVGFYEGVAGFTSKKIKYLNIDTRQTKWGEGNTTSEINFLDFSFSFSSNWNQTGIVIGWKCKIQKWMVGVGQVCSILCEFAIFVFGRRYNLIPILITPYCAMKSEKSDF